MSKLRIQTITTNQGVINIIFGGATNGDSNRMRKAHSHMLESFVVRTKHRVEGPVINFGLVDMEGVISLQEGELIIRPLQQIMRRHGCL